jgi:hypothetical protein
MKHPFLEFDQFYHNQFQETLIALLGLNYSSQTIKAFRTNTLKISNTRKLNELTGLKAYIRSPRNVTQIPTGVFS